MTCTLIKIPYFYDWYEKNFKDLCQAHDDAYRTRSMGKLRADYEFAKGIYERGHPILAGASYVFVTTIGSYYWIRRSFRGQP